MAFRLRRALGTTVSFQAVAMASAIGFQLLAARWLGAEGRGEFALLLAAGQILAMVAGLGLPGSMSYYAASRPDTVPLLAARQLALLAGVAALLSVCLVANRQLGLYSEVTGRELWFVLFVTASVAQPAMAALTLAVGAAAVSNAVTLVAAVGSIGFFLSLRLLGPIDVGTALGAFAAATALGIIPAVVFLARRGMLSARLSGEPPFGRQLRMAGLGFASSVLGLLMFRVDVFLVAALGGGARAAGLYSIGVLAAETLVRVPNWTATVLAPFVSAKRHDARGVTVSLFWASALLVVGASVPILLFPDTMRWLLSATVGEEFVSAYPVICAILPRIAAQAGGAILFGNLAGYGYTRFHPLACGAGLVSLVVADVVLIPSLGVVGAAIGSGVGYMAALVVAFVGFLRLNALDLPGFVGLTRAAPSGWVRLVRGEALGQGQ